MENKRLRMFDGEFQEGNISNHYTLQILKISKMEIVL